MVAAAGKWSNARAEVYANCRLRCGQDTDVTRGRVRGTGGVVDAYEEALSHVTDRRNAKSAGAQHVPEIPRHIR